MSRREQTIAATPDVELEARQSEGRKLTAENELIIIANAKKNVEKETVELEDKRESLKSQCVKIEGEIELLAKLKEAAKDGLLKNQEDLNDAKVEKESQISGLAEEGRGLSGDVSSIHEEIGALRTSKVELENEVNSTTANLRSLQDQEKAFSKEVLVAEERMSKADAELVEKNLAVERVIMELNLKQLELYNEKEQINFAKASLVEIDNSLVASNGELKVLEQQKLSLSDSVTSSQEKISQMKTDGDDRLRIIALAEERLDQKKDFVLRLIEKGKIDKLIREDKEIEL